MKNNKYNILFVLFFALTLFSVLLLSKRKLYAHDSPISILNARALKINYGECTGPKIEVNRGKNKSSYFICRCSNDEACVDDYGCINGFHKVGADTIVDKSISNLVRCTGPKSVFTDKNGVVMSHCNGINNIQCTDNSSCSVTKTKP